jgi:hypothetical protein
MRRQSTIVRGETKGERERERERERELPECKLIMEIENTLSETRV